MRVENRNQLKRQKPSREKKVFLFSLSFNFSHIILKDALGCFILRTQFAGGSQKETKRIAVECKSLQVEAMIANKHTKIEKYLKIIREIEIPKVAGKCAVSSFLFCFFYFDVA